jgi:PDZ domain
MAAPDLSHPPVAPVETADPSRQPGMPIPLLDETGPDRASSENAPVQHWVRRSLIAAVVCGLAAYGLVGFFGHGAHAAPRPHFATGAQQTSPRRDRHHCRSRLGRGARVGLQTTDVVTAVDDVAILSPTQLTTIVQNHHPGDNLRVSIVRGGKYLTISATLDAA